MIGAWLVGDVIVDPGPSPCIDRLLAALDGQPPRAIALTHIHLDHAGATGSLVARFPDVEVWVHERGARHLVDPAKLLASAARLYGQEMGPLWGEVLPVPAGRLRVLSGGERIGDFRVAYTPGHASHHVSYLHESSGWAFTGDVAGVRIGEGAVIAPTPPPDIDLAAWQQSLATLEDWRPGRLALTHFGSFADVQPHLAAFREHLAEVGKWAAELDERGFAAAFRERVERSADPAAAGSYALATSPAQNYAGLRRYLDR